MKVDNNASSCQAYGCYRLAFTEMTTRHLQRGLRQRAASTLAQIESGRPHIAPIPDRSVLEISGKDAQKFLKGLTSRDVDKSPGWGYSGFLTPTVSLGGRPALAMPCNLSRYTGQSTL